MPEYNNPVAQIEIDGVSWENSGLGGMLQSIDIEDEEGANITARVAISGLTMDEMSSGSFKSGSVLRIKLGYTDEMYDWGVFRISKPQYTPGPGQSCSVVLEGQGGLSGASMAYIQVNEGFTDMTIREIVEDIASRFGFRVYFGKFDDPKRLVGYSYVTEGEVVAIARTLAIHSYVDPEFELDYAALLGEAEIVDGDQIKIPIYEGGEPDLDVKFKQINTSAANHFEFLKYLAESSGRVVHVAEGIIDFRRLEDQPLGYGLTDPENTVTPEDARIDLYKTGSQADIENFHRASIVSSVRSLRTSPGSGIHAPLAEVDQAQLLGAFGVSENTEPIHFLYGRDPDQDGQFTSGV